MADDSKPSTQTARQIIGRFVLCNALWIALWILLMRWVARLPDGPIPVIFGAIAAYLIGAASGAYELLKYQRMSQDNILTTDYGLMYWGVNGLVAVLGYTVFNFAPELFPDQAKTRHFAQALVAGTGTMALLRTKYLGFAEVIERWLTYIEEKINNQVIQRNWQAIQEYLPTVGSNEELEIVFERITLESKYNLKPDQIVRINTEIENARSAKDGETGRAYGLLRAYADIVGIDRFMTVLGAIRDRLDNFRRQRVQAGAPVPVPLVVPLQALGLKTEQETTLVLDSFDRSLDGNGSQGTNEVQKVIAAEKVSKEPADARVRRVMEAYIRHIGVREFTEARGAAFAELQKAREGAEAAPPV